MVKLVTLLIIIGFGTLVYLYSSTPPKFFSDPADSADLADTPIKQLTEVVTPKIELQTPPPIKVLNNSYHIFQTFNNCGPAALSMALSYYGINKTQSELGQALRPYQVPGGDNDDKSVTLEELGEKAREYNLTPYHRPGGDQEKIKLFITYDIPVITRTYTKEGEDIGHYRVIKGYTPTHLIQDDSLQGKNLQYTPEQFNNLWEDFSFEYLALVPQEKIEIAEAILGDETDKKVAWQKAATRAEERLALNPNDKVARFNLSVALYEVGDYQRSTEEFAKVESQLSFRTLWYQIEPIKSYFEIGEYQRVFQITDRVLNYHNRAFSELYLIRGEIYKKQGNLTAARSEFEKAVFYNHNFSSKIPTIWFNCDFKLRLYNRSLKSAQDALNSLSNVE